MRHGIVADHASTTLTIRSGVGDGVGVGVGDGAGAVDVAVGTGVGDTVPPFKRCWKPKALAAALATKTSARSTTARENPCRFIDSPRLVQGVYRHYIQRVR